MLLTARPRPTQVILPFLSAFFVQPIEPDLAMSPQTEEIRSDPVCSGLFARPATQPAHQVQFMNSTAKTIA